MSYIFGGQTGLTYEQIQKQREIANELLRANMQTPQNVGEGLSAIGRALAAKAIDKRTERADEANRAASAERRASAFGSIFGGGAPAYGGSAPAQPAVSYDPNSPQGVASDAMAALGKSVYTPGDRESFVAAMMPHALRVSQETGLDPRLVIAQAALETGWGKSAPNNNFFGIKSHGKAGGGTFATREFINGQNVTINDSFRGYGSMGESAMDYARFLRENPRYRDMLSAGDLEGQLAALGASGYATDPNYAASVGSIAKSIQVPGMAAAQPSPQPAPAGNMSMGNPATIQMIADLLADPYTPPGEKAMLEQAMAMQLQGMDPMHKIQMEREQIELNRLKNPQPGFVTLTDEQEAQMGLDTSGVYQQGADGSIVTVREPAAPKAQTRIVTGEEAATLGLDPALRYNVTEGPDGVKASPIGGGGVTVNNTVNPDGAPADDALRKKLMEGEGATWSSYLSAGSTASAMKQDMALLDEVIELAPTGPVTGRLAEMFPGVSDAAGVFQSVVKRVAPSLRVEGSGSQSDIEYNGFLQSLPALQNRPEANRTISGFLKAKAQINMDRAAAVAAYQNGEIDAVEARKRIAEIDSRSIMTPEMDALINDLGSAPEDAVSEDVPTYNPETGMWE